MIKRLVLAILAMSAISIAGSSVAATIDTVISPTNLVLAEGRARNVATFDGRPVFYCGLGAFTSWASPLVGQKVRSDPEDGITVRVDGRDQSLEHLLVTKGWLQPIVLDDDAQAAIAEGRGGWACSSAVTPFELMHTSVDSKVLAGIALNESGFNGRAWPWTLNVAGRGMFFRSRDDAYRAIATLIAAHRCDFDVGIMQVNWCYHRQRFASAWDALLPATNIRVAEDILNENYSKTHSVAKAIAYYHSANPTPGQAYLVRFARNLNQIENGL